MRIPLLLTGFILVSICGPLANGIHLYPEDRKEALSVFRSWTAEYKRDYRTQEEVDARFEVFLSNLIHINTLNKLHRGQTMFAVNKFADLSPKEFRKTVLMPSRDPPTHPPDRFMRVPPLTDPIPESFDWTNQNVVTSVKDQGSAGSCWAFSTIGNLEGQWAMQGKPLTNLSVEQVVDCDSNKDPARGRADCGVFGGWPYLAYQYIKNAGGIQTWTDYPYCCGIGGGPGSCFPCPAPGYNRTLCGPPAEYCLKNESCNARINPSRFVPGLRVSDWQAVSQNETEIAVALMATGPLSVALDASLLQFYHSGVFGPVLGCSKTDLNHAVLMVGFGVEKGIVEQKPYWKIKNSWGSRWGLNGYFYIKRGSGECGINTEVTTALLEKA
ncbi:hypothetical protein C0Q70_04080 [Pomacea canaliculata]|uniref:Uncharacterized protein n=2 Tax=Pomacea canaliculata TaxID=400727 RepID=A0A2T7PUM6_POMCA|nr:hypothetical protein C0Q70_04080 [Pomacea canaliculata]